VAYVHVSVGCRREPSGELALYRALELHLGLGALLLLDLLLLLEFLAVFLELLLDVRLLHRVDFIDDL
jgi:hypothetical protein